MDSVNFGLCNYPDYFACRIVKQKMYILTFKEESCLCYDSKEDTLFMALIFSLLRDGGELSLMKGDNNLGGINLPRVWLLFFRNVNTYRVTS